MPRCHAAILAALLLLQGLTLHANLPTAAYRTPSSWSRHTKDIACELLRDGKLPSHGRDIQGKRPPDLQVRLHGAAGREVCRRAGRCHRHHQCRLHLLLPPRREQERHAEDGSGWRPPGLICIRLLRRERGGGQSQHRLLVRGLRLQIFVVRSSRSRFSI